MSALEVQLILLGLWVEILVDLVPFWWDAFELFVRCSRNQGSLGLAHLADHMVDLLEILCPVQLAHSLVGGLRGELW